MPCRKPTLRHNPNRKPYAPKRGCLANGDLLGWSTGQVSSEGSKGDLKGVEKLLASQMPMLSQKID